MDPELKKFVNSKLFKKFFEYGLVTHFWGKDASCTGGHHAWLAYIDGMQIENYFGFGVETIWLKMEIGAIHENDALIIQCKIGDNGIPHLSATSYNLKAKIDPMSLLKQIDSISCEAADFILLNLDFFTSEKKCLVDDILFP